MDKQPINRTIDNEKSIENSCDPTNKDYVESMESDAYTEEKSQWHKRDIFLKKFFRYKSILKDFVNGYYYEGREVISEDMIEIGQQEDILFSDNIFTPIERDVSIFIKNKDGKIIAFIGIENQTHKDYKMAARVIGYDGATIRGQYNLPIDKLYFVNTVVINYSKTDWKEACFTDLIPQIDGYEVFRSKMTDTKLNILNISTLTPELIYNFGDGDLRLFIQVVHDILTTTDKDDLKIINNIKNDKELTVIYPTATALAIKAVTKSDTYLTLVRFYTNEKDYREGEQVNMCDVLGYYMEKKDNEIAEKDTVIAESKKELAESKKEIAEKDNKLAEKDTVIAEKDSSFVTYLVKDNKTNEQIKKIVHGVNDDFINKIRANL